MPYTESNLAVKEDGKVMPALVILKDQFEKENFRQSDLLDHLQNKLHNLLNKRSPEKEGIKEPQLITADFNSAMENELNRLRKNTIKLQNILNHFEEIL